LIDSWNSFRLMIPFRCIGYVESNSIFKHPARRSEIKDYQTENDNLLWIVGTCIEFRFTGTANIFAIYIKQSELIIRIGGK
jgi:hypothetical protein